MVCETHLYFYLTCTCAFMPCVRVSPFRFSVASSCDYVALGAYVGDGRATPASRPRPGVLDVRGRSDFSRFDLASPGDGPTLATLVSARGTDFSKTLLAAWIEELFCGGARRRCGHVEAAPHFSTPGAKATDFSRFCAHLQPLHFSRFDPKVPHFSN